MVYCIYEILRNFMIADLPICPENYLITSEGQVISKRTGRKIKAFKNSSGYLVSTISYNGVRKSFSVHRQVLLAFTPIPDHEKFDVNHLDGDKTNNCLDNLDWYTKSDNMKHAKWVLGKRSQINYKKIRVFNSIWGKIFYNAHDVATFLGVHIQSVYRAVEKGRKTLKGFELEYI